MLEVLREQLKFFITRGLSRARAGFLLVLLLLLALASGADAQQMVCADCHGITGPHGAQCEVSCLSCHNDTTAPKADVNHPTGAVTPGIGSTACIKCHLANGILHQKAAVDVQKVCGQCHGGDAGTAVNGAKYKTTAELSAQAKFIHSNHALPRFFWSADSVTSYKVNFDAGTTICPSGASCSYSWDFGGGLGSGSGINTSYLYGGPTPVNVALTVTVNNFSAKETVSMAVTPSAVNVKPLVSYTSLTQTGYTVSFTDTSSAAAPSPALPNNAITVKWGDGTISTGNALSVFSHPYPIRAATYTITHTATNSGDATDNGKLSAAEKITVSVPMKYTVSVNVTSAATTSNLSGATVALKANGKHTKATGKTNASGNYTFSNVLSGSYTIRSYASGHNAGETSAFIVSAGTATQNMTLTAQ